MAFGGLKPGDLVRCRKYGPLNPYFSVYSDNGNIVWVDHGLVIASRVFARKVLLYAPAVYVLSAGLTGWATVGDVEVVE